MTTLTWPSAFVPSALTWHLEANTSTFQSPLTRGVQTAELAGARWKAELTLPPMQQAAWRSWVAFLAKMRGQAGRVYVVPWHAPGSSAPTYGAGLDLYCDNTSKKVDASTPLCDAVYPVTLGTPVIDGAAQSGNSIAMRGFTPSCYAFKAGDFFHYNTTAGRTLHMVVEDAITDAWGEVAVTVEPPIRTAPADAAAVTIANPSCVMRVADDANGAPAFTPGLRARVNVSLVESFT